MSDQDAGKKMVESYELDFFIYAYEDVTGEKLSVVDVGERPDFICQRPSGRRIGIELTKVITDQTGYEFDRTYGGPEWRVMLEEEPLSGFDVIEAMYFSAKRKQVKMSKGNWRYAKNTILVLQLVEVPLQEIMLFKDSIVFDDFRSLGFKEIWAADYTEIEAYDSVELLCLHPHKWRGYHRRPHQKPYG